MAGGRVPGPGRLAAGEHPAAEPGGAPGRREPAARSPGRPPPAPPARRLRGAEQHLRRAEVSWPEERQLPGCGALRVRCGCGCGALGFPGREGCALRSPRARSRSVRRLTARLRSRPGRQALGLPSRRREGPRGEARGRDAGRGRGIPGAGGAGRGGGAAPRVLRGGAAAGPRASGRGSWERPAPGGASAPRSPSPAGGALPALRPSDTQDTETLFPAAGL